jgi:hypothetical protein
LAATAAELVGDPAAHHMHQPPFEGAHSRVVAKVFHLAGHADDRFLNGVLGFLVTETGADGRAIKQFPVSVEEFTPASLVAQVPKPLHQRKPRWRQLVVWLGIHLDSISIAERRRILQKIDLVIGLERGRTWASSCNRWL